MTRKREDMINFEGILTMREYCDKTAKMLQTLSAQIMNFTTDMHQYDSIRSFVRLQEKLITKRLTLSFRKLQCQKIAMHIALGCRMRSSQ